MALDKFQPYLFVSAGEQSNKFLAPTYADGVASFQAQRAQSLTGLTVRIDPIQEGTGEPSPSNIRPISGRTGLTVTRAGKNLLNTTLEEIKRLNTGGTWSDNVYTYRGVTFTVGTDADGLITGITVNGTATTFSLLALNDTCELREGGILSGCPSGGSYSNSYSLYGADMAAGQSTRIRDEGNGATSTTNYTSIRFFIGLRGNATANDLVFKPMIRNSGDSTYEPYTAQTYPITWESIAGTVYGGTLDVVSGVLTVDWDYIASYDGETLPGEWISDRDVYVEGTTPTAGAEVAYKLAEPVTYQLTPTDIKTLAGFNQIYSDAGPVIDIKF